MDIAKLRDIVANMLEQTGHGNTMFIRSVREGEQDDGPFMRAALAVRDVYDAFLHPAPEEEPDE